MKLEDLIKIFPWADHPLIRTFAEDFTDKLWQLLDDAELGKLVDEDKISDESLLIFLERIKKETQYSSHVNFQDIVTFYLRGVLLKSDDTVKKTKLPFCSAIHCLLKFGFDKDTLNNLLRNLRNSTGLEFIFVTATALCQTKLTNQEKGYVYSQEWKNKLSFFSYDFVYHIQNPSPEETFKSLKELSYYKFHLRLKKNLLEFSLFLIEIRAMEHFYEYSMNFLNQLEVVNTNELMKTSLKNRQNYTVLICDLHIQFSDDEWGSIMTITYEDGSSDKMHVSEQDRKAIIECEKLQDLLKHFPKDWEFLHSQRLIYNKIKEYADSVESAQLFKAS